MDSDGRKPVRPGFRLTMRWAYLIFALLGLIVAIVAAGELVARYGLGLGDPPLSMSHPTIEYLFRPDHTYQRFGNRVHYNAYSMRSEDFPPRKQHADAFRVLMLGDSVINGGNLTDQAELASERLKRRLRQKLDRPVTVGNASAGSWGPGNLKAYVELYGLFDADLVILVLSSHDWRDARAYEQKAGVKPGLPSETPALALKEGFARYLPRYLPEPAWSSDEQQPASSRPAQGVEQASQALGALLRNIQRQDVSVLLAQHARRDELDGSWRAGRAAIRNLAQRMGVPVIQLAPVYRQAINSGRDPYRDAIHPNPLGQRLIAERLFQAIRAKEFSKPDGRARLCPKITVLGATQHPKGRCVASLNGFPVSSVRWGVATKPAPRIPCSACTCSTHATIRSRPTWLCQARLEQLSPNWRRRLRIGRIKSLR